MSEFERLLSGFLDEGLSAEERERLAELIESNGEYRARYLEHCSLHAALAWEHGALGEMENPFEAETSRGNLGPFRVPIKFRRWKRSLAWAAGFALVAGFVWQIAIPAVRTSQWQSSEAIGSIVRMAGGELRVSKLAIQLEQGDSIKVGEYELTGGIVQVVFNNEVHVLIEAPARFSLETSKQLLLSEGRLSANVPPQGVGFTVQTPSVEVVDYGTEFGVEVDAMQRSEVHVFEGEVEVKTQGAFVEPVRLVTDQATRVDTTTGELSGIAVEPQRFLRSFEEPMLYYSQGVRSLNPAVYYRMAVSDDGLTLLDRSGGGFDGRIETGMMERSAFAPGRIGKALRLEGPSGMAFAMVPDYPKATNDRISVVAWVYAESRPTWASIAKNWTFGETGQFHFGLRRHEGELEVQIRESDGSVAQVVDSEPLPLNEWHHVAFVADGEFVRLYRDGVEVAVERYDGLVTPSYPALGIGVKPHESENRRPSDSSGSLGFWDGRIDELAIFNHALAAQDIERLYQAPKKGRLLSAR